MKGITGKRVGYVEPGSDAWMKYMTASKIAAVMGHSPYESRFSLWHRMAGTIPAQPDSEELQRGTLLEPAICDWWATKHPDAKLYRSPMYRHPQWQWAAATPDRIIRYGDGREPEGLEAKTANNPWEWGEEGTDEIPPYYFDQTNWQMGVLGIRRTHVAALMSGLSFRQYVVSFDKEYFARQVGEAQLFMDSLWAGEKPGIDPLDGHMETYLAIRHLHPDIELEAVEVPFKLALDAQDAVIAKDSNDERIRLLKIQLTDLMGTAKDAYIDGQKIARRQAKGEGAPYVVFPPGLKKIDFTKLTHITESAA